MPNLHPLPQTFSQARHASGTHQFNGLGPPLTPLTIFLQIFRDVCTAQDLVPQKLVFGSGLGIPYHSGDTGLDLTAIATGIAPDLDAFRAEPRFAATQLVLELGRYLVGEAGYFVTRVIGLKRSRGSVIGICDGGMNNHLPASGHFGMVIHRNYRMHRVGGGEPVEKVDLVGPLSPRSTGWPLACCCPPWPRAT